MPEKTTRDYIIDAANQLFYQQGYAHTSFANIAAAVQISRGNFYHHFKSKDEILDAVIHLRLEDTRKMLEQWERESENPVDRIKSYSHILLTNWSKISCYGCPVGTLCTELAKLNHISQEEARKIFSLFHSWLRQQFVLLGQKKDADYLAMHVIAWSQGVATLASTFQDENYVRKEVKQMDQWLALYAQQ